MQLWSFKLLLLVYLIEMKRALKHKFDCFEPPIAIHTKHLIRICQTYNSKKHLTQPPILISIKFN